MFLEKSNRRIIPRWRDFLTTCALGELDAVGESVARRWRFESTLEELKAAWLRNRTAWYALDLLGAAFVVGQVDDQPVAEAAEFIKNHPQSCPQAGLDLARRILSTNRETPSVAEVEEEAHETIYRRIHLARKRLAEEPRNSILWIDLARYYTVLGNHEKASAAADISCKLDANNRFILRSAARFYLHAGEKDRALRLIRNSDSLPEDPWLLAAEIGIASFIGASPQHVKLARKVLEDDGFSAFSKSELASALATMEILDGRQRIARKLFRQSLANPTENSLAQAEWALPHVGELNVDMLNSQVPRNYEAKSSFEFKNENYPSALENAKNWLKDQPFSSRPVALVSYLLSAVFERDDEAEKVLRQGLLANPADRILQNNLAFSLGNQDRIEEGTAVLARTPVDQGNDSASVSLRATAGLLMFRSGQYDAGRTLYLKAMEQARRLSLPKYEAMAALYWAREELLANLPTKDATLALAKKLAEKHTDLDLRILLKRLSELDVVKQKTSHSLGADRDRPASSDRSGPSI